jgi:hypothetical protein
MDGSRIAFDGSQNIRLPQTRLRILSLIGLEYRGCKDSF